MYSQPFPNPTLPTVSDRGSNWDYRQPYTLDTIVPERRTSLGSPLTPPFEPGQPWLHGSASVSSMSSLEETRVTSISRRSPVDSYILSVRPTPQVTLKKPDGTLVDVQTLARNNSISSLESALSSPGSIASDQMDVVSGLVDLVKRILNQKPLHKALLRCRGTRAQRILDQLQELLTSWGFENDDSGRSQILKALMRLCVATGMYPQCLTLRDIQHEVTPVTEGQFGDIRRGNFRGCPVCLKVVKLYQQAQISHLIENFYSEGLLWSHLSHRNLLPFYGIYQLNDGTERVCLVSPWMKNGNICDYLINNPDAPRIPLIRDIILGLDYLHRRNVVHGDLKGANILVTSTATRVGGTLRWQAPELMEPASDLHVEGQVVRPTLSSDVYSLASVMYEVLTDKEPFYEYRGYSVLFAIGQGKQPSKPSAHVPLELTEQLWKLMTLCWDPLPANRPLIGTIVQNVLNMPVNSLTRHRMAQMPAESERNKAQSMTPEAFRAAMWHGQGPRFDVDLFISLGNTVEGAPFSRE
ncbi:kinase-like protein [Macrolepiota fuliginosa MF-IS2]|uniref:Kinase-like protein n=1 Tax=Macrolepiota fuliginosa MF-IS2 TaxID=1400762 RepID=A0A9P6C286_9AGAR|nr:kinase-like protein [Macrolepiota fuliginosa MF-IS2]